MMANNLWSAATEFLLDVGRGKGDVEQALVRSAVGETWESVLLTCALRRSLSRVDLGITMETIAGIL